ncbi:MAG: dephospho-CoA kinase [Flavobacteriales bacterium]|nr:MAG: dephospho-CoA kinase [Flavobacteriales bacterium]
MPTKKTIYQVETTKIIGLTGGIGSGKSAVSNYLKQASVSVYDADTEAKKLMHNDSEVKAELIRVFGSETYVDGVLQTKVLARKVFNDKNLLSKLNAIVHPAVRRHLKTFVEESCQPYVIVENAILYESGFDALCHFVVCVTAPLDTRISRVMTRDGVSHAQVMARINNQWDEADKVKRADMVITNIDWAETEPQIEALIKRLDRQFGT